MSARKKGEWRNRMFKLVWLYQMGKCETCATAESFIWRKGGVSGSFHDGDLYQIVWRTSNLELDHITPLHLGGTNDFENLQLLCRACHRNKTTKEHSARLKSLFAEARA